MVNWSKLCKQPITPALFLVVSLLAVSVHRQTCSIDYSSALSNSFDLSTNFLNDGDGIYEEDEASYIIQEAFNRTYAHILPCNDDLDTTAKECMLKTRDYFNANFTDSTPWWFLTLLRDLQVGGAFGFWHHFATTSPPFHFCTIEKVGTTEWRNVFCKLNAEECKDPELGKTCRKGCAWKTRREMPSDAPWAVFLRDPLERLLSAYLDKCEKPAVRRLERHCEPNLIFNPDPKLVDGKGKKVLPLTQGLEDKKKQMFEAYLDAMPFKWNLHFLPQALSCNLLNTLHKYDFVGDMGKDFMVDLDRLASRYGDPLPKVLNDIFKYAKILSEENEHNNTGSSKRHATHAPSKVSQFYTGRTVRKALEYVSIDYVTLGLEVPGWAKEMLREDERG